MNLAPTTTPAEPMVVNCVAYDSSGKRLPPIEFEQISDVLQMPDTFLWVGLHEPSEELLTKLQEEFNLHDLAVEDAHNAHQRPKIESYGESLFIALHTAQEVHCKIEFGETHIFLGPRYMVTVRHGASLSYKPVRARCEREPELLKYGAGFVLYALMDTVVDRYFPILDSMESELEQVEEQIFVRNAARSNIEALYALKQRLMVLKHAVDPLMEGTGKLYGGRVPQVCAGMQEYFRDVYDHLHRIHLTIEGIRDMLTTAIQVNLGMISLSESEVTKRLAAWAAIIAVPTMLAGIYGMNFKHMPELEWSFGYPLAIATMAVIDAYLYVKFKRARWL